MEKQKNIKSQILTDLSKDENLSLEDKLEAELINNLEDLMEKFVSKDDIFTMSCLQCDIDSSMNEIDYYNRVVNYYDLGFYKEEYKNEIKMLIEKTQTKINKLGGYLWNRYNQEEREQDIDEYEKYQRILKKYYCDEIYFNYSQAKIKKIVEMGDQIYRVSQDGVEDVEDLTDFSIKARNLASKLLDIL